MNRTPKLVALVMALFVLAAAGEAPTNAVLVDHRALYRMSLARTTAGSDIQGLSGEMLLEVKSTCEGSTVTQMLKTDTWGDDQVVQRGALTASSFESRDGKSFRFAMHNDIDGSAVADFEGTATRTDPSAAGTIAFEKDAFPPVALPPGAFFPGAYMEQLLAAAEARERVIAVTVFDGAEQGRIFRSTSIIGPRSDEPVSTIEALAGVAHWPVVLSYFPLGSNDDTPEYESSFDLYWNGVSGRLLLDYGDFAMKGELTSLQILPMPQCN